MMKLTECNRKMVINNNKRWAPFFIKADDIVMLYHLMSADKAMWKAHIELHIRKWISRTGFMMSSISFMTYEMWLNVFSYYILQKVMDSNGRQQNSDKWQNEIPNYCLYLY